MSAMDKEPEAPAGFSLCEECHGVPSAYALDTGVICPLCDGSGVRPDEPLGGLDWFELRSRERRELGTYRVVRGRIA